MFANNGLSAWQSAAKRLRSSTTGAALVLQIRSKLCRRSEDLEFSAAGPGTDSIAQYFQTQPKVISTV